MKTPLALLLSLCACGPALEGEEEGEPLDEVSSDLTGSVLVATLNIQEGRDASGDPALSRQIACLAAAHADVVLLQESALPGDSRGAWTGQYLGTNNATRIAGGLGFDFDFTTETADRPMTDGGYLHYGVAILWRKSLDLAAHSLYAPSRGLRNGVQWVDVPVGSGRIRLFNGHMHTDGPTYEEQGLVRSAAVDPSRTVVMGDLNGHDYATGSYVMGPGNYQVHYYQRADGSGRPDAVVNGSNVVVGSVYKICQGGVTDHPWGLAARMWPR